MGKKINTTDINHLRKYVNGELNATEMYAVERAAHENEMLMDVIVGLELEKESITPTNFEDIRSRITERVTTTSSTPRRLWKKIGVAASLLFLLGFTGYWLSKQNNKNTNRVASADGNIVDSPIAFDSKSSQELSNILPDRRGSIAIDTNNKGKHSAENDVIAHSEIENPALNSRKIKAPLPKSIIKLEMQDPIAMNTDLFPLENRDGALYESNQEIMIGRSDSTNGKQIITYNPQNIQSRVGGVQVLALKPKQNNRSALNRINLDPQTSQMLGQVLDKQSRTSDAVLAIKDLRNNRETYTDSTGSLIYVTIGKNKESDDKTYGSTKGKSTIGDSFQSKVLNRVDTTTQPIPATKTTEQLESYPSSGWNKFKAYLLSETKRTKLDAGMVELVFNVGIHGRPENVRVGKSSNNPLLDKKAIAILTEGPHWIAGTNSQSVQITITFN